MTDATAESMDNSAARRYIYNQADMEHFRRSAARKELLSFVSEMGRGLTTGSNTTTTNQPPSRPHGGYIPHSPLDWLTPALASLHGSLSCMSDTWLDQNHVDGIPLDLKVKARFGNPAFRTWHSRLVERSDGIVRCLMDCHVKYLSCSPSSGVAGDDTHAVDGLTRNQILTECSSRGYRAASNEGSSLWPAPAKSPSRQEEVTGELQAYLHDSFGHPVRIDYGTGHESSFAVFLLSLCKIGCFYWGDNDGESISKSNPPPEVVGHASLALFHAYLNVTRGLQRDYMLEPAGSHGVWGLDDYHCIPFYLGACQMMAREQSQKHISRNRREKVDMQERAGEKVLDTDNDKDESANRIHNNPYLPINPSSGPVKIDDTDTINDEDDDHWAPSVIHNHHVLDTHSPTYIYLSCIQFIRQIKPNAPFFESSPMLDDISNLGSWSKAASGLLRLYEGEVLDKLPVVQHFVFGKIFSADWSPSRKAPLQAPETTFAVNVPMGEQCVAPWANGKSSSDYAIPESGPSTYPGGMPPTRAPWAK